MQPQSPQDYKQLLTDVIKKQIVILGPDITLSKARNVKGITVADDGTVTNVEGQPQEVTQALIDQFVQLSGLIVKKTMEPLLALSQPSMPTPAAPLVEPTVVQQPVAAQPTVDQPKAEVPTPVIPSATEGSQEIATSPAAPRNDTVPQPTVPANQIPTQTMPAPAPTGANAQLEPATIGETPLQPAKNPLAA